MRKLYFLFFLLLSANVLQAQVNALLSVQGLGGDKTDLIDKHAIPTDDGGMIIRIATALPMNGNIQACGTVNNYEHHFRKYRYNNGLVMDWERCYAMTTNSLFSMPYFLFPADNGDFYTVRRYQDTDSVYKWGLAKEDAGQNVYWIKGYEVNVNSLRTVTRTADGGFLMAFESYGAGGEVTTHYGSWMWEDIWLLKLDSLGNKLWSKTIGGSNGDYPVRLVPLANGRCYLLAASASYDYDFTRSTIAAHYFIVKLDSNGDIIFAKNYGGSYSETAYDGCSDGRGGILMCGIAGSNDGDVTNHTRPAGEYEGWVINVDSNGTLIWDRCFEVSQTNVINRSSDNTIWVTGKSAILTGPYVDISFGFDDVWTARMDSSGQVESFLVQGTPKNEQGEMTFSFSSGITVVGGEYQKADTADGGMPDTYYGGVTDVFLAILAPWTTSVATIKGKNIDCSIYPNPATDRISIIVDNSGVKEILITDISGRVLYRNEYADNSLNVDVSNWTRGLYYVHVNTVNGRVYNEKLIVT